MSRVFDEASVGKARNGYHSEWSVSRSSEGRPCNSSIDLCRHLVQLVLILLQLIDFSKYLTGDEEARRACGKQIFDAFQSSGFIYLKNHGIPKSTVSKVFKESAQFFKRPQDQKDGLGWTTPRSNRGYVAMGREKVTQSNDAAEVAKLRASNPDIKESMEIGKEGDFFPNQWPDKFDAEGKQFTFAMKDFFLTCKNKHIQVMRAIALGMGLKEDFFDGFTDAGDNTLRLLHYPEVKKAVFKDNPDQVRAGEHSDYGSITLLFQDNVGGLEVKSPKGTFVRATPIEDTIVINAADLLSRWSNDAIVSTKHRVVQPPPKEDDTSETYPARYSIAYFCNPNLDKYIEALPNTYERIGKKYEGINSGDYLEMRLAATY